MEWDDIASLALGGIGILVSLAGFTVAFLQIRKTRKATEAATEATEKSQAILTKNVMLADLPTCIGIIETAKLFLNSEKFDAALVKLKELQGRVIQLRAFENHLSHQECLQEIIGQVAVMNDNLERQVCDTEYSFNVVRAKKILSAAEITFQKILGKGKYQICEEGIKNDT